MMMMANPGMGLHMRVRIDDSELGVLPHKVRNVLSVAMELTATDVWGGVRKEAPVAHGRLAGSFQLNKEGDMGWRIWSDVNYALAVHEGTGPRTIYPKNKKALYWPGAWHPVKKVNHPGTKANPFASRAVISTERRIPEFARMAVKQVLGE